MKPAICAAAMLLSASCSPVAPPREGRALTAGVEAGRLRETVTTLAGFGTRHTLSDALDSRRGIGAARRWIHGEFDRIATDSRGRLRVEDQVVRVPAGSERIPNGVQLVNVLATLEGWAPEGERQLIIISGHYDSRAADVMDAASDAPGANDDASGVAAVLECARVLSAAGPYRQTIVFAAVAGEEQGLTGAAALAARAREEKWPVEAMLDNDIVGNSTGGSGQRAPGVVRVFSEGVPSAETPVQMQSRQSLGGENDGPSRQLARYIEERAAVAVPGFAIRQTFRRDRYARGGDHIPFLRAGFAAVRLTEPYENFSRQHADVTVKDGRREGDLPEFVDYGYLAQVTRVNVAALAGLASAPGAPRGVSIDPGLSYDAALSWTAVPGAARYNVRARTTTAAQWERTIPAGEGTSITLRDYSKDDWMFAVEAVDAAGHVSLPTVPVPQRARRR